MLFPSCCEWQTFVIDPTDQWLYSWPTSTVMMTDLLSQWKIPCWRPDCLLLFRWWSQAKAAAAARACWKKCALLPLLFLLLYLMDNFQLLLILVIPERSCHYYPNTDPSIAPQQRCPSLPYFYCYSITVFTGQITWQRTYPKLLRPWFWRRWTRTKPRTYWWLTLLNWLIVHIDERTIILIPVFPDYRAQAWYSGMYYSPVIIGAIVFYSTILLFVDPLLLVCDCIVVSAPPTMAAFATGRPSFGAVGDDLFDCIIDRVDDHGLTPPQAGGQVLGR